MKLRVGIAAALALVVSLVFGPATSSSAPGENAVVHWSGVAEAAISAGATPTTLRPPASSTVLAGMVHGAMYDAVAAVEGGLRPFATDVSAPADASAEAAVAQAARDVLVARVPGQAATVQAAYDAYMAAIPAGTAKDGGKAVGAAAAAGMLALRTGDHFDDVVPYTQPQPGPGVFEPIAPTTPVDVKLGLVRPFTYTTPRYRPDAPFALTSKKYAQDVAEVQELGRNTSTARTAAADRDRPLLHRPDVRPVQPWPARPRERARARPARVGKTVRLHVGRGRGHDDRLLGGEVPLHALAAQSRDPAGGHGRKRRRQRPTRPGCRSSRATTPNTRPATRASRPG